MERLKGRDSITRARILRAAGEAFSENGFRHATVRDICRRAGVNVAAVNYHFGDKERLYIATIQHWKLVAFEKYPHDVLSDVTLPPEKRLEGFVRSLLSKVFDTGEVSWFAKLVAREYMEPTGALDMLVEDIMRPTFRQLSEILRELMGGRGDESTVWLCAASIVGQCFYFHTARPVIWKILGKKSFEIEEQEMIATHIVDFSLRAICSMGDHGGGEVA